MRTLAFGTAAFAIVLVGCSTQQPVTPATYSYESQQHSGTVIVEETFAAGSYVCDEDWRDATPYTPSGLRGHGAYRFDIEILAQQPEQAPEDISVLVPALSPELLYARDFQKSVSWILAPESHGPLVHGGNFFYPTGYYVRASNLSIKDNDLRFCLGVDRMYVPAESLNGVEPLIHLDRIKIPFTGKPGDVFQYTLGGAEPVTLSIRVNVK